MTRPKGSTSDSSQGHSQLGGTAHDESARAVDAVADAVDEPLVTEDQLDARDRRQARGRKKPGPTRTPPAKPKAPPAEAPPTEL